MATRKLIHDFLLSHSSLILPQQVRILFPFIIFFILLNLIFSVFIYFYLCDRVLDRGCFLIWLIDEDTVSSMSSLRRLKMKLLGITAIPLITFKFHF